MLLVSCSPEAVPDEPANSAPTGKAQASASPVSDQTDSPAEEVERSQTLETSFGKAAIDQISIRNGAHAQGGRLHIRYIDENGEVIADFPEAVEMGSWGSMGDWSVSEEFSNLPVIVAEGGGTWQGYTMSFISLTELQPTGPVPLANFQIYASNGGAMGVGSDPREVEGQIKSIDPQGSFSVQFTGTENFISTYRRQGDVFELVSGKKLEE